MQFYSNVAAKRSQIVQNVLPQLLQVPTSGVVAGGGQSPPPSPRPSDNFLGELKSKGGAKIRNCQCEILYKSGKSGLSTSSKIVVILAFL